MARKSRTPGAVDAGGEKHYAKKGVRGREEASPPDSARKARRIVDQQIPPIRQRDGRWFDGRRNLWRERFPGVLFWSEAKQGYVWLKIAVEAAEGLTFAEEQDLLWAAADELGGGGQ